MAAVTSRTVTTALPTPTPAAASSATSDRCEVCLLQPRAGVALVPCGHSRFCATCADFLKRTILIMRLTFNNCILSFYL